MRATFARLERFAARHGVDALELFEAMPDEYRDACWDDLAARCATRAELARRDPDWIDPVLPIHRGQWFDPEEARERQVSTLRKGTAPAPSESGDTNGKPGAARFYVEAGADPLLAIAPADYFAALADIDVPPSGMVRCPLHEDRNPSCKVYPTADQGWCCFAGCGGGTVYDLAREISGIGDRGAQFVELRKWTAERLLGAA